MLLHLPSLRFLVLPGLKLHHLNLPPYFHSRHLLMVFLVRSVLYSLTKFIYLYNLLRWDKWVKTHPWLALNSTEKAVCRVSTEAVNKKFLPLITNR